MTMNLKPQDVVVALKLCGYPSGRPPISIVASDLGLSPSEVHGAIQRLRNSKLLHGPALKDKPNISALEEFLVHGLKYVFPAEHGEVMRGIPTSYAAATLKSEIAVSSDLPPVWPWHDGDTRGVGLAPLYKSVPHAALRDPALYQLLALVDAIRDGRARERNLAERDLVHRLKSIHGQP
jgi:DNA-binding Lrp family transcriptional regulator